MNATDQRSDLRPADVRRRFDRAAERFDAADFVHRVTRDGLLERMRPMTAEAANVIDLGSATGTPFHHLMQDPVELVHLVFREYPLRRRRIVSPIIDQLAV